ncbi:MAG: SBBP repeat-containing protein [Actinomycetota bacterium]|nr:SBBP repeat-containing protein [Actinomycetota bacterium]
MNADPRSRRRTLPASIVWTLLALLLAGLLASAGYASPTSPPDAIAGSEPQPTTGEQVIEAYGKLPLSFVPNQGQVADEQVRYHAQGAGFGFSFTPTGAMLSFVARDAPNSGGEAAGATEEEEPAAARGTALALDFLEANPEAKIEAREELAGKVNYLRGSDSREHQTDLPTYGELVYEDLWAGVDAAVRGEDGSLKYEFLVEPGASVEDIGLAYRGADGLSLDEEGNLRISTPMGELTDSAPVSYQEIDGERVPLESRYVLDEGVGSYGFEVGTGYDPALPLVIDPDLTYSTFLGGTSDESGEGITVDESGRAYVTGSTRSANYPITSGAFDATYNGSSDAVVTKLSPAGSAVAYSTFLGGTGLDTGRDIAVKPGSNAAYVTGWTDSAGYPTTPGDFDTTYNGGSGDAFVTKLPTTGGLCAPPCS